MTFEDLIFIIFYAHQDLFLYISFSNANSPRTSSIYPKPGKVDAQPFEKPIADNAETVRRHVVALVKDQDMKMAIYLVDLVAI